MLTDISLRALENKKGTPKGVHFLSYNFYYTVLDGALNFSISVTTPKEASGLFSLDPVCRAI